MSPLMELLKTIHRFLLIDSGMEIPRSAVLSSQIFLYEMNHIGVTL